MKYKFQSFVDIQTSAESMQVIQWSVGGADVVNRCRHLFGAYKYFKLGKISVKMVPASTLPVDPLGLSYTTDDPQTVDPRDQMNPGLVRITNGEDIFTNVSTLSAYQQEQMYNAMMLDPRWSKFMLQSGFRRSAYPMYWQVGQLSQDKYPGATANVPLATASAPTGGSYVERHIYDAGQSHFEQWPGADASSARGLFQVGHRGKLGFLPTDYFQAVQDGNGVYHDLVGVNNVPEVSVITCVLPKAYKTVYYYRVFITEEVIFAGLRSIPPVSTDPSTGYVRQILGIDNFTTGSLASEQPGNGYTLPVSGNSMNNGEDMP